MAESAFRVRCFQPLSHLSSAKRPYMGGGSITCEVGRHKKPGAALLEQIRWKGEDLSGASRGDRRGERDRARGDVGVHALDHAAVE
jgi:hypothetical protein